HEHFTGIGFAGSAGFVAIGAEGAALNETGTQRAHVDDPAEVRRAGGGSGVPSAAGRALKTVGLRVQRGACTTGSPIAVTSVMAGGLHSATAKTLNIATGAVAAGLTISRVNNGRSTEAIVTSTANITTSGAVLVKSDVSNIATAFTPGGTAGGATLAILVPF